MAVGPRGTGTRLGRCGGQGKGGATIKQIRETSGAKVSISGSDPQILGAMPTLQWDRDKTLTGETPALHEAKNPWAAALALSSSSPSAALRRCSHLVSRGC